MAGRPDEAAFAVARVGGPRGGRPGRSAIVLGAAFAAIAGIGWTARGTAEGEPPRPSAPPAAKRTFRAEAAPAVVSPAESVILGGRHPDREHGTDGLLGGIVFGGAEP